MVSRQMFHGYSVKAIQTNMKWQWCFAFRTTCLVQWIVVSSASYCGCHRSSSLEYKLWRHNAFVFLLTIKSIQQGMTTVSSPLANGPLYLYQYVKEHVLLSSRNLMLCWFCWFPVEHCNYTLRFWSCSIIERTLTLLNFFIYLLRVKGTELSTFILTF